MKLSLEFWLTLEFLQTCAKKFTSQIESILAAGQLAEHQKGNAAEAALLVKMYERMRDSGNIPELHVQSVWTGGPSDDPRNHTVREPNVVGISHTFPPHVVNPYRGAKGDLSFPQRETGQVFLLQGSSYWGEEAGVSKWFVRGYLFKPDAQQHLARLQTWLAAENFDCSLHTLWNKQMLPLRERSGWEQQEKTRRVCLRTKLDPQMWQRCNIAESVQYGLVTVPLSFFDDVPT